MKDFADKLGSEILKGLPGRDVQWELASSDRRLRDFPGLPDKDARDAAVMILLYPIHGDIHTVFMQRPEYEGVHGGQISFPGGKKEPSDRNIIETAIREAKEETGADLSKATVTGTLTPLLIPVSNMMVTPVIAWTEGRPEFNYKPDEVVFLFDAEIRHFLNPSIVKTKPFRIREEMINVKYFDYNGHVIWGATAMIMNELLAIIRRGRIFPPE